MPTSSIPPLQSDSGEWAKDPIDKANLLASTLLGKSRLSVVKVNRYSKINCGSTGMTGFLPIRPRHVEAILRKLGSRWVGSASAEEMLQSVGVASRFVVQEHN